MDNNNTNTTSENKPVRTDAHPGGPTAPVTTGFGGNSRQSGYQGSGGFGGGRGSFGGGRGGAGGGRPFNKNGRPGSSRPGGRGAFQKSEFDQKILSLRRVARVTAGGKRFTFSVCLVIGDKKGSVGVGTGKAPTTPVAIEKAVRDGKRNMIKLNTTKTMSIPHEVKAKYCSAIVVIRPAAGKGLIAGSAPRTVLSLAGLTDVNAKILSGSKNKMNNARAAFEALKQLSK